MQRMTAREIKAKRLQLLEMVDEYERQGLFRFASSCHSLFERFFGTALEQRVPSDEYDEDYEDVDWKELNKIFWEGDAK